MAESKRSKAKTSETRTRLDKLQAPEKKLIKGEAEKVNGGGGVPGGVVSNKNQSNSTLIN